MSNDGYIESSNNIISQLLECGLITYDEEEIEEMDEKDLTEEIESLSNYISVWSNDNRAWEYDGDYISDPFQWEGINNRIIIWESYEDLADYVSEQVSEELQEPNPSSEFELDDNDTYIFIANNGYARASDEEALTHFAWEQREDLLYNQDWLDVIGMFIELQEKRDELEQIVDNLQDQFDELEEKYDAIANAMDSADTTDLENWYKYNFNVSKIPNGDTGWAMSKAPKILNFLKAYDENDEDYNQGISFLEALSDDDVEIEDKDQVETYIFLLKYLRGELDFDLNATSDQMSEIASQLEDAQNDYDNYIEDGTLPDGTDYKLQFLYDDLDDEYFLYGYYSIIEFFIEQWDRNGDDVINEYYGGIDYDAYAKYLVDQYGLEEYLRDSDEVHECEDFWYYYY